MNREHDGIRIVSMDEIEAAMARCAPRLPALVEAAFQHDVLWSDVAATCGLERAEMDHVRDYIRAFYLPQALKAPD